MTKKQLKEKYTEWNKEISKLDTRKTKIFHELQELCAERGDGKRWCSIEKLVEELTKTGNIYKAMNLVSEYYQIEGQNTALRNLAIATNNFDI
ncbi:MAG: hypothetical protein Q4C65_03070 [Eubacteriales bacterium]|nr:hypothetical protein [Eubacteriales bacterium]